MRYAIIVLFFTLFSLSTRAQELVDVYDLNATSAPHFPGGVDSLDNFLQKNIKFPSSARIKSKEDTVFLGFTVDIYGSISDITTKEMGGEGYKDEAIRVVKSMP